MAAVGTTNFDSLEIKTRSIEQTLLPLVKQVISHSYFISALSSFMNFKFNVEISVVEMGVHFDRY